MAVRLIALDIDGTLLDSRWQLPEANRAAMPKAKHENWVKPADIARTIAYLCSDDCRVTSGAVIPVYGRA